MSFSLFFIIYLKKETTIKQLNGFQCLQDHRLLLWDQRQQGPSGVVREKAPLISVDFDPKNLFNVAVGSQAGTVSTYDTRSMKVPLTRISEQVDHARAVR